MSDAGEEIAFPVAYTDDQHVCFGLSKREYFAAMAMQGLASRSLQYPSNYPADDKPWTLADRASWAVKMADALIEELEK